MIEKQYNFNEIPNRIDSESVKWNLFGGDVLPMWVADMDFFSPPSVREALKSRVDHGVFGYGGTLPGLLETTAEWIKHHYQWDVKTQDLVLIPGVVTGFNLAARSVTQPGEGVLFQSPVYPPFFKVAKNHQLIQQDMELIRNPENQQYSMDFDLFESSINANSKIFILCNPHNPTGRVFSKDELERVAEICLRKGILICSDEIHCDILFSGSQHIPIASLDRETEMNSITLIAPSKTFNIPGLDCSFAIIKNPELRQKFEQSRSGMAGGVNILGQVAGHAAYQHGDEWLQDLLVYLEENRDFLFSFIRNEIPQMQMPIPEGTYLAWIDCHNLGLDQSPCEFFLQKAKLAFVDGAHFGPGGENFIRLNFGCPRSILEEALVRMKKSISELNRV